MDMHENGAKPFAGVSVYAFGTEGVLWGFRIVCYSFSDNEAASYRGFVPF